MIEFPVTLDNASVLEGAVVRAGGTDLQERLRSHNSSPHIVDLSSVASFADIKTDSAGVTIGAGVTLDQIGKVLSVDYPALALTARHVATPQVRSRATIGGNLMQHTRCWYYRHPDLDCYKSGGDSCPSREGRHLYGVVFDTSDCVHPHPSSMAMALLAYDASVNLNDGSTLSVKDLLGDGSDPTRDNTLEAKQIIASISLPAARSNEKGAYYRSISRFRAEWPLVEAAARCRFDEDTVTDFSLAIGGVATVPLRLQPVEQLVVGQSLDDQLIARAAQASAEGANPLPETGYKVDLIVATVAEVLQQLRSERG